MTIQCVVHSRRKLADLARHILDIEGHVARELAGGDPSWTGANGTQANVEADAGVLAERLEELGETLEGLLSQVVVAELARLTVALQEFDHCAMHYGQMQLTRHLWEGAHPDTASTYLHWR